MLTRDEICRILKISSDDLKNWNRRRQLPFADVRPTRGEYSPYEALLGLIVDDLCESPIGMSRAAAASIVGLSAQYLMHDLTRVGETSRDLAEGRDADEILVRFIWTSLAAPAASFVFCGTIEEIQQQENRMKAEGWPIVRDVGFNASRAAAVLRSRAASECINLGDLWGDDA
jgi:hypothetical protein